MAVATKKPPFFPTKICDKQIWADICREATTIPSKNKILELEKGVEFLKNLQRRK